MCEKTAGAGVRADSGAGLWFRDTEDSGKTRAMLALPFLGTQGEERSLWWPFPEVRRSPRPQGD